MKKVCKICQRNDNEADIRYANIDIGVNTLDKVFILGLDEVLNYFDSDIARICMTLDGNNDERPCCWWLRTIGSTQNVALRVDVNGRAGVDQISVKNAKTYVRPCIWVDASVLAEIETNATQQK